MLVPILMAILMSGFMLIMVPSFMLTLTGTSMPPDYAMIISLCGFVVCAIPTLILLILAKRSSAIHIMNFPRRGEILWLYVLKGGNAYFVPSKRLAQAHLWSKGRGLVKDTGEDSRIIIGRHDCRIVKETVGHTINPIIAQYMSRLRKKYGMKNIAQARNLARFVRYGKVSEESVEEHVAKRTGYRNPVKIDEQDLADLGISKSKEGKKNG